MRDGKDSELFFGDLIDDAVRKPAEKISPASATKYGAKQGIGQDEIGRSFKLGYER